MKKTYLFFLTVPIFLLCSCNPQGISKIEKSYPILAYHEYVKVYNIDDEVPLGAEVLGTVKVINSDYSSKCNYESAVDEACLEARKVGGNAIKIIEHMKPNFWVSCHRVNAEILRIEE